MRFAYIDSQGNEVPVPSVDALGLRIELGAIGPETQLYDAQADRWGPANTHELYHTISRGLDAEGYFASAPAAEAPGVPEAPARPPEGAGPDPSSPSDAEAYSLDRELTEMLTDTPAADPPVQDASSVGQPTDSEPFFDLAAEIASVDEGLAAGTAASLPEMPSDPVVSEDFHFDLTLADLPGPEPSDEEALPSDHGGLVPDQGLSDAIDQTPPRSGNELELEQPLSEMDLSAVQRAEGEAIELDPPYSQTPVSDMASEASPPVEGPEPARPERAMDFSRVRSSEDDADPHAQSEFRSERRKAAAREPRSRPSPPRRTKSRPPSGLLFGVLAVALIGAGGYFGWSVLLSGRGSGEEEQGVDARPPVTIPYISGDLLPRMRELGDAAMVATIAELQSMQDDFAIPAEPRDDWLAGVYLAGASGFQDVEAYWQGIRAYVAHVREVDGQVFHEAYSGQMEEGGVTVEEAALLQERADSGFLATRPERLVAYGLMDDLANAALDLHTFLLANEANIAHEPAGGGVSRDPVLEAVPSSAELGDRMWDMVDRITEALDSLGTLDRVTTARLSSVLFDRILQIGFQ